MIKVRGAADRDFTLDGPASLTNAVALGHDLLDRGYPDAWPCVAAAGVAVGDSQGRKCTSHDAGADVEVRVEGFTVCVEHCNRWFSV